jgi:hypothetical protein
MSNNKLFSAVLFVGLAFPLSARAQFLGYTSPQTVQTTLANGLACTGAPQTFITGGANPGFANLGQTQHYITVMPSAAVISIKAEIDGLDSTGNVFRLSDHLIAGTAAGLPLAVTGSGYYPRIQVMVTCGSATGTFTLNYSGASSTSNLNAGSYFLGQVDKSLFAGAPANTSSVIQFQPPFGSAAGTLFFTFGAAGPGGSTLQVQCSGNLFAIDSQVFSLATSTSVQAFSFGPAMCTSIQINYTSGGASAAQYSMEYVFYSPGANTNPGSWQAPNHQSNTEQTSAANASVSKSIAALASVRAHVFSVSARCSAGTANLVVLDGATQIWSTAAAEVTTTTFRFQWNPGLAGSMGNGMTITLSACGAANTGTLDVQSSQF